MRNVLHFPDMIKPLLFRLRQNFFDVGLVFSYSETYVIGTNRLFSNTQILSQILGELKYILLGAIPSLASDGMSKSSSF